MRTAARSAAHASPAARAQYPRSATTLALTDHLMTALIHFRFITVFSDPACANATSWLEPGQHAVARRRPWIPDRIILPFYHPTNIPTETENSGVLTDALRYTDPLPMTIRPRGCDARFPAVWRWLALCLSRKGDIMDAQLSISVEEHDAGPSATHHRGAHRRGCNHLTI
ncbi:hypothetical protein HBI56_087290 [Parastagonospora nodorum]|uniref:Uncharacterized protein n=1 Tax=Phaeosphaeria nodorum (strain SN15 / ATCC MYA-4574 / FGSC 10173) TaxID=321614 RepID=A0A7U2I823_PHANO|nr:hypothetical protein HBH56_112180 [Parastagonospora nodorum]QRD03483.1 hypothetical protein JI435_442030 [Parastagonospora nodorum SN15]KAH3925569.1 hypothetical protein HBH54_178150 [Parastagonospora nodorum]KAH3950983.1 hypothetical protein HBH53_067860 [Parastagonospora nodorum]KAH4138596.1 hypothetical protein HBH45_107520 [Parastagonospora nodorum]